MYNQISSMASKRPQTKLLLLLVIVISFALAKDIYATDNFEAIFPKDCQTNVTTAPILHLRSQYPIDINSIKQFSPESIDSNNNSYAGNVIFIEKNLYENYDDTLHAILSQRCELRVVDTFNLYILGSSFLKFDTEYNLVLKDNIKLLKPNDLDPNQIDTVSDAQTFECLFKTKEAPLEILSNSIPQSGIVGCEDTLKLYFNKKINLTQYQLDNLVKIEKVVSYNEFSTDTVKYSIDTVSHDISISNDSLSLNILPSEIENDSRHFLNVDLSVIHGGVNPPYNPEFFNYSTTKVKITTIPKDTSITLTEDIQDFNGKGQRLLSIGDTLQSIVPLISGDLVFEKWLGIEGRENITSNANSLIIVGNCTDMRPYNIAAVYKKIPIDTLQLDTIRNSATAAIHTCSKYVVSGYKDSLNPYLYTYKRFAESALRVHLDVCNNYTNDVWDSPDSLLDGKSDNTAIINRSATDIWNEMNINYQIKKHLGIDVIDVSTMTCSQSEFYIVLEFVNENGFPDEFNGTNIKSVFNSFTFDGANIPIIGFMNDGGTNGYKVARKMITKSFPYTANYSFVLNDNYAIRGIKHQKRHAGDVPMPELIYGQYEYPKPSTYSSGVISVKGTVYECTNDLIITVTKRPAKVSYEVTEKDGEKVPSLSHAWVNFVGTQPSNFLNKPAIANNTKYIAIPQKYDDNNDTEVDRLKVDVYFENNISLTAERKVIENKGFANYIWKSTTGYTSPTTGGVTAQYNIFTTSQTPILMGDVLSSKFRLEEVWTVKSYYYETEPYKKYYFSNGPNDGTGPPGMEPFVNINENEEGDGLYTTLPFDNQNYEMRQGHLKTTELVFLFNEPLYTDNLSNCIYVDDGRNEHDAINKELRKDGYDEQKYRISLNENQDRNSNISADGKSLTFDLVSLKRNGKNYAIPHLTDFHVYIKSVDVNASGNTNGDFTIYSRENIGSSNKFEPLSNLVHTSISQKLSIKRRTNSPAINVKHMEYFLNSKGVDNAGIEDEGDGEFYFYQQLFHNADPEKLFTLINEESNKIEGQNSDGEIVLNSLANRYPNTTVEYLQGYIHTADDIIFQSNQIRDGKIAMINHFIESDDSDELEASIDVLIEIAELGVDLYLQLKGGGASPTIKKISELLSSKSADKLKEIIKVFFVFDALADDDDYVGISNSYLTESGEYGGWEIGKAFATDFEVSLGTNNFIEDMDLVYVDDRGDGKSMRWVNWGAGPYGLYSNNMRESFVNYNLTFSDENNNRIYIKVNPLGGNFFRITNTTEF